MRRHRPPCSLLCSGSSGFWIWAALVVSLGRAGVANAADGSSIQIELFDRYASFVNRDHPNNRLGYRFHEHTPLTYGNVSRLGPTEQAEPSPPAIERIKARPGARVFHRGVAEEGWIRQDWTFYLAPVADGIEMLWVVKTGDAGLPEFYGVQQCFRLTGVANEVWRQHFPGSK